MNNICSISIGDLIMVCVCVFISVGTESFGLFSCTISGEERDQTHRAVYR